jgi:diamine N-acetyltransferase
VPVGPRRNPVFLSSLIAGPDSIILVAGGAGNRLLGLIILFAKTMSASVVRDERRILEIDNLVVRADARRSGIARSLLDAASEWGKTRDATMIELTVWAFNEGAQAFYETAGFETGT